MGKNLLQGKRGIIFGALNESTIAWQVAEKCAAEGAQIVLTNAPVAARVGQTEALATRLNAPLIYADVTKMEDLENLVTQSVEKLGGKLDFVLHSVGMSLNVRKKVPYTELNYDWMHTSIDISAMSFHRLMQVLYKHDAVNEWGSIVALTYIAAQRVFPDYSEMAEAKSMLESIARSFGYHYGKHKHVRVNTISQSPTYTTAGSGVGGFDAFYNYSNQMSPLGNASAEDCANFCISMFSDYTRMVTMQNLYHDGGFSTTGIAQDFMESFSNAAQGK
jgi:enoyl-[acyl-carrier protein] reductase I